MNSRLIALPNTFSAGTTVQYWRSYADYPASAGWQLKLHLRGASALDLLAEIVDGEFRFTLSAAATAALTAGGYSWIERVSKDGEAYDVASGVTTVTPNFATAGPGALQSENEKTLAILIARREGRLTSDMESYEVDGRRVIRIPTAEIDRLIAKYKALVHQERNPGQFGVPVSFQFVRPT